MTKKRIIILILVILLVLIVGGLAFAGNYFYDYALKSRRNERAPGVPQGEGEVVGTSTQSEEALSGAEWLAAYGEDTVFVSYDGTELRGKFATNADNPDRYAILMHGYTGNGSSMAGFGMEFYERGFNVLMPDCRGHGKSGGNYIGMGWHDRLDLVAWINKIVEVRPSVEIVLFGISMGGATVMMASGEALPPNVKLIIEDCGYTSVWDEFSGQLKEQFGLPEFPIMQAASVVTKIRAGWWLSEADAVKQVAKSTVPMLFIHGDADTFVPFWMLEPLYEAKTVGDKEKLVVAGAGHGTSSLVDPQAYWGAIDAFIEKHM